MTSCDNNMTMKTVGIAELKARLSEHLQWVRRGRTLTVMDRSTPVARIVPYETDTLEIRRATRKMAGLTAPPRSSRSTDSVAVLLDDRRRR